MKAKRFFSAAKKDSTLELMVYDEIGASWFSEGVTAKAIKEQIDAAGDVSKIVVRLNSPGGDVFEGAAIYSLLSQHPAEIECYVDGLAASAAFTIAMAGDSIHVSETGMMMVHNAWGVAVGDAGDMRKTAETLDKINVTMRDLYAKRSGMDAEEMQAVMDAETWLTGAEAVEKGFADDVIASDPAQSKAARALAASFDLKAYKHPPKLEEEDEDELEVPVAPIVASVPDLTLYRQRIRLAEIA